MGMGYDGSISESLGGMVRDYVRIYEFLAGMGYDGSIC